MPPFHTALFDVLTQFNVMLFAIIGTMAYVCFQITKRMMHTAEREFLVGLGLLLTATALYVLYVLG